MVALLLDQHDRIRRLLDEVAQTDSPGRKCQRFEELRRLLAVHETAEGLVTHPLARMGSSDGIVDSLLQEENKAKLLLADVEKLDVDDPGFADALRVLRTAVLKHAQHEELDEFPLLRLDNDERTLVLMAAAVRAAEAVAPTHPHPWAGESVTVNAVAGPIAGLVDRTRDAVRAVLG